MVACIIVGLEYMHSNGVLHRDIKPENLVIDERGYVRVTDLGIARIWTPENSQETSGTPGYMAPEVMCRQNHTIAVDYFAVGVIGFEFMMGKVSTARLTRAATLHGEVAEGHSRPDFREAGANKEARNPGRVVDRGGGLHQQVPAAQASEPTRPERARRG